MGAHGRGRNAWWGCGGERVPPLSRTGLAHLELEQQLLARLDGIVVRVHHDGQPEDVAVRKLHGLDDCVVRVLVEETRQRREAAVAEQLDVARLTLRDLDSLVGGGGDGRGVGDEEVDERATVRRLLGSHRQLRRARNRWRRGEDARARVKRGRQRK